MAGKMLLDMGYIILLLLIVLISFGIVRQAILVNSLEIWDWHIISNITHEPYFMLYGEVYADGIDPCKSQSAKKHF